MYFYGRRIIIVKRSKWSWRIQIVQTPQRQLSSSHEVCHIRCAKIDQDSDKVEEKCFSANIWASAIASEEIYRAWRLDQEAVLIYIADGGGETGFICPAKKYRLRPLDFTKATTVTPQETNHESELDS